MTPTQKDELLALAGRLLVEALHDNAGIIWANYDRAKQAHNSAKPFRYSFPVSVKIGPEGRDATPVDVTLSPGSKSKIEASASVRMGKDMVDAMGEGK